MTLAVFAGGVPGLGELAIILLILILLFGSSRLPRLARSLGASLTEFKRGKNTVTKDEQGKG